jgi:hypothetical protein
MAGRHFLFDVPVLACPAGAPLGHFANALGTVLAQQIRQIFVAQSASGINGVLKMELDRVGLLFA